MINKKQREVLDFIKVIRNSFPCAQIVYTFGACYGFHKILEQRFGGYAYFDDEQKNHIVTKIDDKFFDICGLVRVDEEEIQILTGEDHIHWETVAQSQRIELISAKYQRHCAKIAAEL